MNEESPQPAKEKLSLLAKKKAQSIARRILIVVLSPYRFFRSVCFITGLIVWAFIAIMVVVLYFFYSSMPDFEIMTFKGFKGAAQKQVLSKLNDKAESYRWRSLDEISRDFLYSIFKNKYLAARHKRKLRRILKDMLYKELISPQQYRDYSNYSYFD